MQHNEQDHQDHVSGEPMHAKTEDMTLDRSDSAERRLVARLARKAMQEENKGSVVETGAVKIHLDDDSKSGEVGVAPRLSVTRPEPIKPSQSKRGVGSIMQQEDYNNCLVVRCGCVHPAIARPVYFTTSEKKYNTVPCCAEFFCSVSSPFIALPAVLFFAFPGPLPAVCVCLCMLGMLTALASTVYHWFLCDAAGTCDLSFAIGWTYAILSAVTALHFEYAISVWQTLVVFAATAGLMALSRYFNKHDAASIVAFVGAIPWVIWMGITIEAYFSVVVFLVAVLCIQADRTFQIPTHSFWHILLGVCVYGFVAQAGVLRLLISGEVVAVERLWGSPLYFPAP